MGLVLWLTCWNQDELTSCNAHIPRNHRDIIAKVLKAELGTVHVKHLCKNRTVIVLNLCTQNKLRLKSSYMLYLKAVNLLFPGLPISGRWVYLMKLMTKWCFSEIKSFDNWHSVIRYLLKRRHISSIRFHWFTGVR